MARILLIDDSPALVAAVRETLTSRGHEVDDLSSFLDLPHRLRDNPPDLVLLDLNMPMMSGEMAASYIRKYQEAWIPILIHSSKPEAELREAVRVTGADGYICKGATPGELSTRIHEALSRRGR